jgi:hypothetical protein
VSTKCLLRSVRRVEAPELAVDSIHESYAGDHGQQVIADRRSVSSKLSAARRAAPPSSRRPGAAHDAFDEIQIELPYSAALLTRTQVSESARALLAFLATAEARRHFHDSGAE